MESVFAACGWETDEYRIERTSHEDDVHQVSH